MVKAFLVTLLLLSVCGVAKALSNDTCLSFYRAGKYAESVECLNARVYAGEGRDTADLLETYEALGVNYMMLDKKPLACEAFNRLLCLRPDHELDPSAYLPEIVSLYQTLKLDHKSREKPALTQPVRLHAMACRVLPLGAPQFVKKDWTQGFSLMALQAVSLGVSVYCYSKKRALYSDDFHYAQRDVKGARTYDALYKTTFLTFSLSFAYSLMDGFLRPAKGARP